MTDPKPDRSNPDAPFGYDEDGKPNTPLGLKTDGKPRMDRRGATRGQFGTRGSSNPGNRRKTPPRPGLKASATSLTDNQRKGILLDLAGNFLVNPLVTLSQAPLLKRYIGQHADALAGDALILNTYAPALADGLIIYSKSRPKTLAWMEKVEDNAGLILILQAALQAGKSIADNHLRPNPAVAEAGRNLAAMRIAEMAEEINRQAAAMRPQEPMPAPAPWQPADEPTVQIPTPENTPAPHVEFVG